MGRINDLIVILDLYFLLISFSVIKYFNMHEKLIQDVSNEDGGLLMAYSRLLGDCVKYQKVLIRIDCKIGQKPIN